MGYHGSYSSHYSGHGGGSGGGGNGLGILILLTIYICYAACKYCCQRKHHDDVDYHHPTVVVEGAPHPEGNYTQVQYPAG